MDEDGDLLPEDDVKPATNIEPAPPRRLEEGSSVSVVRIGGNNSSVELRKGKENERMAGGDVEEEEYEDEEEHGLVMDEHEDDDDDDNDNDDENVEEEEDIDDEQNIMSKVEEGIGDGIVDDNVHDDDEDEDEEGEDEEEEGDSTDGAPPQLESTTVREQVLKRPHIQSKRMQEYQEMQQMTHTPGRVFECPDPKCRRVFNSAPGLRYHVKQTHQGSMESFVCPNCHKKFKSLNGRKYHIKRKRCQGYVKGSNSAATSPSSSQVSPVTAVVPPPAVGGPSRVPPPPLVLPPRDGCPAPRLLDLANIATGPQSPLLQGLGSSRVGTSFFDSPEKNAVMALSSMAQKRSSRNSTTEEPEESSGKGPGTGPGPGVEHEAGVIKSKRPMNGFMLFAQKNRAEFNKMYPHTNNRMISTKLSEEWAKLPEDERRKWKDDARQMAEVQRSKHPDCWKRKKYSKDRN